MLINETPPSIRRIDTDRENALAFEVTGHIEGADIENLYGLIEGARQLHDSIDVILIVHDYEGIDWSAAWQHQPWFQQVQGLKHIHKCAVVGGPAWVPAMIGLIKPFLSAEMKHFTPEEAGTAWEWIEATRLPDSI